MNNVCLNHQVIINKFCPLRVVSHDTTNFRSANKNVFGFDFRKENIEHVKNQDRKKYVKFRDIQNTKIESYYAKFQESNDVDLEQKTFTRHFTRLSNWNFIEWFLLQNTAVFFYTLIFAYSIVAVLNGQKQISDVVLIMGYVASSQTFLNSFSEIKDSLTDVTVAIDHLARNKNISVIDLDDLV